MKVGKYFYDKGTLSKILTNKYTIAKPYSKNIKKGVSSLKQLFKIMCILFVLISCGNEKNKNISETETKNKIETGRNLRYGSGKVGYITKTEKWLEFVDPDASINAVQIAIDPVNIITLDIVGVNGNSTVDRAVSRTKERYLNFGISSEDIVEKDVKINGYKGKQVTVKIPDGRIFIVNYIENNGNIYHISQEGLPEYQEELKKVVDTWLPNE